MTRTEKNIYRKEDVKSKQNKTTESSTETAMGKAENLGIRRIFVCRLAETSTSVMRVPLVATNGKKREREIRKTDSHYFLGSCSMNVPKEPSPT